MKKTIKSFVEDFSLVARWFYPLGNKRSLQEVEAMYQVIRTMWFDYRDLFPNKGTYKTVRRLFVKYAAEFYVEHRFRGAVNWRCISPDLIQEIVFKARQRWLPSYIKDHLADFITKDYLGCKPDKKFEELVGIVNQ